MPGDDVGNDVAAFGRCGFDRMRLERQDQRDRRTHVVGIRTQLRGKRGFVVARQQVDVFAENPSRQFARGTGRMLHQLRAKALGGARGGDARPFAMQQALADAFEFIGIDGAVRGTAIA
jgi:hypothetical protein